MPLQNLAQTQRQFEVDLEKDQMAISNSMVIFKVMTICPNHHGFALL